MKLTVAAIAASLFFIELAEADRSYTNGWMDGRATFFGRDSWSLHHGSCGFGFVCPNRWKNEGLALGYDLVAISDQSPLFKGHRGAQCGQCLEVSCRNAVMHDRYGERLERDSQCRDPSASVKVKIVDTCDCRYGANYASNARWCCGDAPHLDMSQWALDKLVDNSNRWGVFAIKYRTVNCDAKVWNEAKTIPIVRDPHSGMRGSIDCNKQGGNSSSGSVQAQTSRPAQQPYRQNSSPSKKMDAIKKAYQKARSSKKGKSIYGKLKLYFRQFNSNMDEVRFVGLNHPLQY